MSLDKHFPQDLFGDDVDGFDVEPATVPSLSALSTGGGEAASDVDVDLAGEEYGVGDLGHMMVGGIQDLSWLEVDEQDIARLPKNTAMDTVIPELEEAWKSEKKEHVDPSAPATHKMDREHVEYFSTLDKKPEQTQVSDDAIQRVVEQAFRRAAAGHPLKQILADVTRAIGAEDPRTRSVLARIQDEYGLVGRVFLRAEDYPDCGKGRWKHAARKLTSARYLIAKSECRGCIHNSNGSCAVFSKRLVSEVPWEEARAVYAPVLAATGREVADGDPKEALKTAFLSPPKPVEAPTDTRPVHVDPGQQVTPEQARRALQATPKGERKVYKASHVESEKLRRKAQTKIAKWVRSGLLSREDGARIVQSDLDGRQMLHKAAVIITQPPGRAPFSGLENDVRVQLASDAEVRDEMDRVASLPDPEPLSIAHRVEDRRRALAHRQLALWRKKGWLSEDAYRRLAASKADPRFVVRAGATIIASTVEKSGYTGIPNEAKLPDLTDEQVWAALQEKEAEARALQAKVEEEARRREIEASYEHRVEVAFRNRVARVRQAMDRGVCGAALKKLFVRTIPRDRAKDALAILGDDLKVALQREWSPTPPKKQYDMPAYKPHPVGLAPKRKVATREEVRDMLSWVGDQLRRGVHGKELDRRILARFQPHVLQAGASRLRELRASLEPEARRIQQASIKEISPTLQAPTLDPREFGLDPGSASLQVDVEGEKAPPEMLDDVSFGGMVW